MLSSVSSALPGFQEVPGVQEDAEASGTFRNPGVEWGVGPDAGGGRPVRHLVLLLLHAHVPHGRQPVLQRFPMPKKVILPRRPGDESSLLLSLLHRDVRSSGGLLLLLAHAVSLHAPALHLLLLLPRNHHWKLAPLLPIEDGNLRQER